MKTIVVINGLARGGTNLAANLLAAQEGWHVSDAAIAEIACIDQFLPTDFINHYPKSLSYAEVRVMVDGALERFKARCVEKLVQTVCPSYHSIKTKYHAHIGSYYGVPIDTWGKYLAEIAAIPSFDDLENVYQRLAETIRCTVLAHRTTALSSYAPAFLSRSKHHYWIEVVRDPFDRAVSSRRGHAQCLAQSFLQSKWQLDHLKRANGENFIAVNYEDLCVNPRQCFERISEILGVRSHAFSSVPVTPDLSHFSGNSSRNPDIFNQVATEVPIYRDSIGSGEALAKRERRLGESILAGRRSLPIYLSILALADACHWLASSLRKGSIVFLSLNYLSIAREFGWRKALQRCMGRFS